MANRFSLGLDYGTESARAVLVDVETGEEAASSVFTYPHGVIDSHLPGGDALPTDWALQDPRDYTDVLHALVPDVMRRAGAAPEQVIGVGVDFTACTVFPVMPDGRPLLDEDGYGDNPHAYAKLWKHHAALAWSDRLTGLMAERDPERLARFGGKVSSEWFWPKLAQTADEAPAVFHAAHRFVEAGDWLVEQLAGCATRSASQAGYKAMWDEATGDIADDILRDLHPLLAGTVGTKVTGEVLPIGSRAGTLTEACAERLGLREGIPVAAAMIDAHAAFPAAGIASPGRMVLIMGTSLCHLVMGPDLIPARGIAAVVKDGILPGWYGYEAGQPAVGDLFTWLTRHGVPPTFHAEADGRGVSLFQVLGERAAALRPGQSGLLALDWWNGNRSTLQDADLSGLILGLTLETRAEEIYRALLEASAFGTRVILDACTSQGIPVEDLTACGGLAEKNTLLMQILSDVTERVIRVARPEQATAVGAAIHGAVAAGAAGGGYDTFEEATAAMGGVKDVCYEPHPENAGLYRRLYAEYQRLYQTFGQGGNDVMHRLKAIRRETGG